MTDKTDGDRLKALLGDRNRAAFAREHGLRGGNSLISQHISGNRPISLEAAVGYAKALTVALDDVSPACASLVRDAAKLLSDAAPAVKESLTPQPPDLAALLADAVANMPVPRWRSVRQQLDDLAGHPEMRDDLLPEIRTLLQASPAKQHRASP